MNSDGSPFSNKPNLSTREVTITATVAPELRRPTIREIMAVFARMTAEEQAAEYAKLVAVYGVKAEQSPAESQS